MVSKWTESFVYGILHYFEALATFLMHVVLYVAIE